MPASLRATMFALFAIAAALGAGEAAAQTLADAGPVHASYGYGSADATRAARPSFDMRRSARPDAEALAEAPELEGAADEEEGPAPEVQPVARVLAVNEPGAPAPGFEQTGTASWYGGQFAGGPTANGETFDPNALTAAHASFPMPSLVAVTNLENGRQVVVRVNDRTGAAPGRVIDVSRRAAEDLGFREAGVARVRVRYLGPAPRHVAADALAQEGPASLLPPSVEIAAAPAPVEAPRRVEPMRPAPVVGGFVVQVGAFADLMNAHRVQAALSAAAPVNVEPRMIGQTEVFRVRLGPWADRDEAEAMRQRVAGLGYPEAIVAPR